MKFRQFTNTKGMTLVELLAALSLFALVIALSSTVIIQMVSGESNTSNDISLKQETNLLINEMRTDYQKKIKNTSNNETFNICYQNESIEIYEIIINNEIVTIESKCTAEEFGKGENLDIQLITQNNSEELFELDTSFITNTNDSPIQITIDNEKGEENPDEINWTPVSEIRCEYENNTTLKSLHFKHNNKNCLKEDNFTIYTVKGDAKFDGTIKLQVKTKLIIYGTLYLTDKSKIVVNGGNSHNKGEVCVEAKDGIIYPQDKNEDNYEDIFSCS
ncbi:prepilin-type N-terminal cleavage/methylation domain-containing protein [Oceanobacillus sp. CF4.6]|uniref:prepilin-type N-terminal cleavage/methylation domain-containing protein n=1 Tax=Oceanobacillus sp. CF4.6 TaxID=3373080 RepID=UPI003EE74371